MTDRLHRRLVPVVIAAAAAIAVAASSIGAMAAAADGQLTTAAPPLRVQSVISLGQISGRIDHLAFDPARGRLYVAELGNDSVGIVDLGARRLIRTVSGFHEPQGIGYEHLTDTIYVANAADGSVTVHRGQDFALLARIPLGSDADNIRIDEVNGRVYVGYGAGRLAVIDSATRQNIADIVLPGHPEGFQLDPAGDFVYVNVPDASQIAVISRNAHRQVASWSTGDLRANFPLALDGHRGGLISVFRQPPRVVEFDLRSGTKAPGISVCRDSDDIFVDAKRQRVYVICGEGYVDTLALSDGVYKRVGRLETASGSRTGLFIPQLDRLLIAVRASGDGHAAIWLIEPHP